MINHPGCGALIRTSHRSCKTYARREAPLGWRSATRPTPAAAPDHGTLLAPPLKVPLHGLAEVQI